jgi:tetratricopeptide (TPR) repeat protein
MGKRLVLITAILAVLAPLAGCAGKSAVSAYLLDDAKVGGDAATSLKPIKSVLVWPLENIAAGGKSKGVETPYTGLLVDILNLRSGFDRVVILEEDQAKDLMARAGEELGLKKKPKSPGDGALIATKLGQLSGTEAILMGRIEIFDEDKVDKATITVVGASFNLLDAREKAYPTLDSFSPVKRVWRTNIKRVSKEGPFNSRESIDEAGRLMLQDVVDRLTADLGQGADASGKAQARRVAELVAAAEKSQSAGEYDKAIAGWNEVQKIEPENKKAKKGIEAAEKAKRAAAEKEKAAALAKQIAEIQAKAEAAEKDGNPEAALAEWKKILELDKKNKAATAGAAAAEKQIAEKKAAAEKKAKEDAEKKAKEDADKKAKDEADKKKAAEAAPKAVETPKAAEPAKPAEKKAEEAKPAAKAAEPAKPAEPAKAAEPAKPVEAAKPAEPAKPAEAAKPVEAAKPAEPAKAPAKPAEAAKPAAAAAGGDIEALRNQAMAAFNKEDYPASRDLWKQILEKAPDDKQAKEMLETTEMLLNALK